jgi:hypothetical protein
VDLSGLPESLTPDDFAILLGVCLFCSNYVVSVNAFAPGLKQGVITLNGYARDEIERLQKIRALVRSTKTFFFTDSNG